MPVNHGRILEVFAKNKVRLKEVFVYLDENVCVMSPRPLGSSNARRVLGRCQDQCTGNLTSLASRSSIAYIGPLRGPTEIPRGGISG
jgi:hypothetical protein